MVCKSCGNELAEDAKKCSNCGAEVVGYKSTHISDDERSALFDDYAQKQKNIKRSRFLLFGGLTGVLLITLIAFSFFKLANSSSEIDLSKLPYFYEKNGDVYVIYNGNKEGIKLVEDYYDDYCEFEMIDYDHFIVLEDQELLLQDNKGNRDSVMEDIVAFYPSVSGDKIVMINEANIVYLYDGKESVSIFEGETNADFIFSNDEKTIAFTGFVENEKVFYIYDSKTLETLELDDTYVYDAFELIVGNDIYLSAIDNDGYRNLVQYNNESKVLFKYYSIYWDEKYNKALISFEDDIYYYNGSDVLKVLNNITRIVDSEDDRLLIEEDGKLHTYQMKAEDFVTLEGTENLVNVDRFGISSDYTKAVYSDEQGVYVLHLNDDEYAETRLPIENVISVHMSDDGDTIILFDNNNKLYQVDENDEYVKLADNVKDFTAYYTDDNLLVYLNLDNELVYVNTKDVSSVIGDNVQEVYFNNSEYLFYNNSEYLYYKDDAEIVYAYKVGSKKSTEIDLSFDYFYDTWDFVVDK